jgi:hypothetical protein
MRLSDWRARAPAKDSMAPKVIEVIEPVLVALGADADPGCWIVWGDDPAARYLLLVPTDAGLLQIAVRVNVPQEGPRASGKLTRWSRVSVGELAVEMADRHRLLSFQVEGQVLKGTDDDADAIAAFALELFAAIDGRPFSAPASAGQQRGRGSKTTGGTKATRGTKTPLALPAPRDDGS